jgi:hypothetical protein
LLFLIEQELDADGEGEKVFLHFVAKAIYLLQS